MLEGLDWSLDLVASIVVVVPFEGCARRPQ